MRAIKAISILMIIFFLAASVPAAEEVQLRTGKAVVYFFWSVGCPHCKKEKAFLDKLSLRYPALQILDFEVKENRQNAEMFVKLSGAHGVAVKGVPATFIGGLDPVIGYSSDETTGAEIEKKIAFCLSRGCGDPIERLGRTAGPFTSTPAVPPLQDEGLCREDTECPEEKGGEQAALNRNTPETMPQDSLQGKEAVVPRPAGNIIRVPLIGDVDLSSISLPSQTLIIAGLDGFNPCAFFVLFTLLGLMAHAGSRRKVLLIGGVFVFFSGLFYFLFMAAWLNVFLLTGEVAAVTAAAAVAALIIAGINIKDFFFFGKGVSLTIPGSAKPGLFQRMRGLMAATSVGPMLAGTVVLAAAANTYELFCTAGFPMVYTRILTLRGLPKADYYFYLLFYNVVYVLPLTIIVLLFAVTLGSSRISRWHGQVLKLVSGMMMLGLGTVLLVDPALFNNLLMTVILLAASVVASGGIVLIAGNRLKKRLHDVKG